MADASGGMKVKWYRCPLKREDLSSLNRKSDLRAWLQTGGFLGLLILTGAATVIAARREPWFIWVPLLYLHGTCANFLVNGFHELVHESVFKTRWLNVFFTYLFAFFGWYNPVGFWTSHTEHHKFTLHPPDDLEVVLPAKLTMTGFLQVAFLNRWMFASIKNNIRLARGGLAGEWEHHLFDDQPALRRQLFNWARVLLIGHLIILAVSCYFRLWMLPIVVSFSQFYGGGLHYLCNNSQHAGLKDNVEDFRLCCRTLYLNPVFEFLYWHMNYHTEHHMYAGVPCYNLPRLHELIRHEMPPCPNGLIRTWQEIGQILKRQAEDPSYQFTATVPTY